MNPMQSITTCMKKFGTTSGRATRSEFWWFWLMHIMVPLGFIIVANTIPASYNLGLVLFYSGVAIYLITIPPTYCAVVRRFHDTGRTGKNSALFIISVVIVAIVGFIVTQLLANSLTLKAFSEPSAMLYALPGLLVFDGFVFWVVFVFILMPLMLIALVLLVIMVLKLSDISQPGLNKYGPKPHEVSS